MKLSDGDPNYAPVDYMQSRESLPTQWRSDSGTGLLLFNVLYSFPQNRVGLKHHGSFEKWL
jgi:hypothetical protein